MAGALLVAAMLVSPFLPMTMMPSGVIPAALAESAPHPRTLEVAAPPASSLLDRLTLGTPAGSAVPVTPAPPTPSPASSALEANAFSGRGALILSLVVLAGLLLASRRVLRRGLRSRARKPLQPLSYQLNWQQPVAGNHLAVVTEAAWLDAVLQQLAHSLAQLPRGQLPTVIAARLGATALELVMQQPEFVAPQPWSVRPDGLCWQLARSLDLGLLPQHRRPGPFPALVTVGCTAGGDRWMLDLGMIGSWWLTGAPERALGLARHLMAQLARNTWTGALQVSFVGFEVDLAERNPERFAYFTDPGAASAAFQAQPAATAQITNVVLIAASPTGDQKQLQDLLRELRSQPASRAVAIVLTSSPEISRSTPWAGNLDQDGILTIPMLNIAVIADRVPEVEATDQARLTPLAAAMDARPTITPTGTRPWDQFSDIGGGVRAELTAARHLRPAAHTGAILPQLLPRVLATPMESQSWISSSSPEPAQSDPTLDADLAHWHEPAMTKLKHVLAEQELFKRLRARAVSSGTGGIRDLELALNLVTGRRLGGAGEASGILAQTAVSLEYVVMISHAAHILATHYLAEGEAELALAAAEVALSAGTTAYEPFLDCAAACYLRGMTSQGTAYLRQIIVNHDLAHGADNATTTYEVSPVWIYQRASRHGWSAS